MARTALKGIMGTLAMLGALLSTGSLVAHAQMSVGATPLKTVLELAPGETDTFTIDTINRNDSTMTYTAVIKATDGADEFGNASLVDVDPNDQWSLPNWITIATPEVSVAAFEMGPMDFEISVPANTPPGGYYGVVIFSPKVTSSEEGNVAVVGEIGTPIIVKVSGDVTEEGNVQAFDIDMDGVNEVDAIPFRFRFENTGNVHLLPQGQITLEVDGERLSKIGKILTAEGAEKIVDYIPVNAAKGYVLPESTRTYIVPWEMNKRYGEVKATYTVSYGEDNPKTVSDVAIMTLTREVQIENFAYDKEKGEFAVTLHNKGNVQMAARGQINIYSMAGGDPKVTISFPQDKEPELMAAGETKEIFVPWDGYDVLNPTPENQHYAIVNYIMEGEGASAITSKINLELAASEGSNPFNAQLPYIVIIVLLIGVIGILAVRSK